MSFGKDPIIKRKPDTTKNADGLDEIIARQREREKNFYPIRVNRTTVVLVGINRRKCKKDKENEIHRR